MKHHGHDILIDPTLAAVPFDAWAVDVRGDRASDLADGSSTGKDGRDVHVASGGIAMPGLVIEKPAGGDGPGSTVTIDRHDNGTCRGGGYDAPFPPRHDAHGGRIALSEMPSKNTGGGDLPWSGLEDARPQLGPASPALVNHSSRATAQMNWSTSLPAEAAKGIIGQDDAAKFAATPAPPKITLLPPTGALAEEAYISGVSFGASASAINYWNWNNDAPATYASDGTPGSESKGFKWGGSTIGSGGGTVTYWFDTPSNWTTTEQNGLASGLALWSAEANISFTLAANQASANVVFFRGSGKSANTGISGNTTSGKVGTATDGSVTGQIPITIDTSVAGFGPIGAGFNRGGAYPYDTLVHEEGHMIGLGHGGPYNAGDGLGTVQSRQFGIYDSRLWTIMSYIDPTDSTAPFFSSYTVKGTVWGNVTGRSGLVGFLDPVDKKIYQGAPTTPMLLDVLGAQWIYGAATSGPLASGGQIFGFNCNIPGTSTDASIRRYFDFTVNANPIITLWDGGVNNTLDVSGWATASTINLDAGSFSSCDGLVNNICIAIGTRIDNAVGGSGVDTIRGNSNGNVIKGGDGADVLYGWDGNQNFIADADTLQGGLGADTVDGGAGIDTADYSDSSVGVSISLSTGKGAGGTAEGDLLANIEILNGSAFGDTLRGDTHSYALYGQGGDDTLVSHNDAQVVGGIGDDTYIIDTAGVDARENANEGRDTIKSYVNWVLKDNFEDLTLMGSADIDATGNAVRNTIIGNAGSNRLEGDLGYDTLTGGLGNDTYVLDDINVPNAFLGYQYDTVTEKKNAGYDTVQVYAIHNPDDRFSVSGYTLGVNIENGEIETGVDESSPFDLTGNELDNTLTGSGTVNVLTGGDGSDILDGRGGLDTLVGGAGNDVYELTDTTFVNDETGSVYDHIVETADGGRDLVIVTPADIDRYYMEDNVEDAAVAEGGHVTIVGNILNNVIIANSAGGFMYGGEGRDALIGGTGSDILSGNEGNDRLKGGLGFDTLDGGQDIDTADYSDKRDSVAVTLNGATATTVTVAGSAEDSIRNIENILGGSAGDQLIGDSNVNVLTGNRGNDFLSGGDGLDTLIGGVGNDIYTQYGAASDGHALAFDTIVEEAGGGTDTVYVSTGTGLSSFVLDDNVENALVDPDVAGFDPTIAFKLVGNAEGNTLVGQAEDDTLVGKGGADTFGFNSTTFGLDRITDFIAGRAAGHDRLRIATAIFSTYADLLAHTNDSGANTIIRYDATDKITLVGVQKAELTSADVVFL